MAEEPSAHDRRIDELRAAQRSAQLDLCRLQAVTRAETLVARIRRDQLHALRDQAAAMAKSAADLLAEAEDSTDTTTVTAVAAFLDDAQTLCRNIAASTGTELREIELAEVDRLTTTLQYRTRLAELTEELRRTRNAAPHPTDPNRAGPHPT